MVSQDELYSPVSINLGFVNEPVTRRPSFTATLLGLGGEPATHDDSVIPAPTTSSTVIVNEPESSPDLHRTATTSSIHPHERPQLTSNQPAGVSGVSESILAHDPPPASNSNLSLGLHLTRSNTNLDAPRPVAEHENIQTRQSGYSIQFEIKTCVHGTLDNASGSLSPATPATATSKQSTNTAKSKLPASYIVFEVDFGYFAQTASLEFRFRAHQATTTLPGISALTSIPAIPTGVSIVDYAFQETGEVSLNQLGLEWI
jgi:hypothetical protein